MNSSQGAILGVVLCIVCSCVNVVLFRLRTVSYFSLQSYCTRNPSTERRAHFKRKGGRKQSIQALTCTDDIEI